MLKTAFAISFRLGEYLVMPDDLRYVSYLGMAEDDDDIMIASLISLGTAYRPGDISHIIAVVKRNISDLNQQIMYNIAVNSDEGVITDFLGQFFVWNEENAGQVDLLDYISTFWNDVPPDNKNAIITAFLMHFEQVPNRKALNLFEMLFALDTDNLVHNRLQEYMAETSEENKQIISDFLLSHEI
jgi:hypothetical protein